MLDHICSGATRGPTIVLCHGFGANMHDLIPIAAELGGERYRFVFPQAPAEILGYPAGRAWFPRADRDLARFATGAAFSDLSSFDPAGLSDSARELVVLLEQLEVDPDETIVGGFSQGAMVACELVFGRHWQRPAGLLVLSGSLIAHERWSSASGVSSGLPVLQSHGSQDTVLPIGQAERLAALFEGAGADHRFVRFAGGHAIPGEAIRAAADFATATLG